MLSYRALSLLVILLLANVVRAAEPQCSEISEWRKIELTEEDLLISLLRYNKRIVEPSIDVYQYQDTYLLPLSTLSQRLQLDWSVNLKSNLFSSGKLYPSSMCAFSTLLSSHSDNNAFLWAEDDFDIYLDVKVVVRLLGGEFVYSPNLLQLAISSPHYELQTNELFADIPNFQKRVEIAPSRVIPDSYDWVTSPLINYRLRSDYASDKDDIGYRGNIAGFFDLFKHEAQIRLSKTNTSSDSFFRLSRTFNSHTNGLTKGLRYEVGDIQMQSDSLLNSSRFASGFKVFNQADEFSNGFSAITLEEVVLPGWRGQLFRNGQFVGEAFSDEQSRLVFNDVESFFGTNFYEIKLFGPQGQQETRQRTVNVGKNQIEQGKVKFGVSYTDASKRFIDGDLSLQDYDQSLRGDISYGVSDQVTLNMAAQSDQLEDGTAQNYLTTGLFLTQNAAAYSAQFSKLEGRGHAIFAGVTTDFGKEYKFTAQGRFFDDFVSDLVRDSRGLNSDVQVRLNARSNLFGGIGWNVGVNRLTFDEEQDIISVSANTSKNILGGNVSTGLRYANGGNLERVEHSLNIAKSYAGWNFSGSLNWQPFESDKREQVNARIRWPRAYTHFNLTRLNYRAFREHKFELQHQFSWRLPLANVQFGASLNSGKEWTVNIGITGDIEYNHTNREVNFYRQRGSSTANIDAFVFLDENRNGLLDENEQGLSDVSFSGRQQWKKQLSDEEGRVRLSTTAREQKVKINFNSLNDPFYYPADELVLVNTHQGGFSQVAFPVVAFSDVEGAIYRASGDKSRGIAGLAVQLIDKHGEVIAEAKTEVDGYYYMHKVPPGEYRVSVDPEYLAASDLMVANLPLSVTSPHEGDAVRINDLLVVNDANFAQLQQTQVQPTMGTEKSARYYIQLGAFRKPSSIVEVIKQLPTEAFDIRLYRHHSTSMSHAVMGHFASLQEAKTALAEISTFSAFSDAFIVNTHRYQTQAWSLEYELLNLAKHIENSEQALNSMPDDYVVCQVAAYRSLTSIAKQLIKGYVPVHVFKYEIEGTRYYSVTSEAVAARELCQSQPFTTLTVERPYPISKQRMMSKIGLH